MAGTSDEWINVFGGQLRADSWETWDEIRPRRLRDESRVAARKAKMRAAQRIVDGVDEFPTNADFDAADYEHFIGRYG